MKFGKKITSLLLSICFVLIFIPATVNAASGRISFTDLTIEAGEEFEIKVEVTSESDEIGDINITMNYDNQAIQFISGDGVTNTDGALTYSASGSGTSTSTVLTFKALSFGETSITIADATVSSADGSVMDIAEGSSAITVDGGTEVEPSEIPEGNESTDTGSNATAGHEAVTVEGVEYTISADTLETIIPEGYSQTTFEYNGSMYYAALGDTSGIILAYLVDSTGTGNFFYYDEEVATFYPYVQVAVSDSTYIVFLQEEIDATLPEQYVETTLTVGDFQFPTWEDTVNPGYYLINAINSNGETCIYQYDNEEKTYQKYITPAVVESTDAEEPVKEKLDMSDMFGKYTYLILLGAIAFIVLLIILCIVLGVKLRNRNLELDELYDELDEIASKQKEGSDSLQRKPTNYVPSQMKEVKGGFDDGFDDEFDDEFDDGFDDEFDDEFDDQIDDEFNDEFDDDFEDSIKKDVKVKQERVARPAEQNKPTRSIAARRKAANDSSLQEDIDFIDL